jgi:hypothetical protein
MHPAVQGLPRPPWHAAASAGINLCAVNNGGCSADATCTPTASGQRACGCKPGFSGTGTTCTPLPPTGEHMRPSPACVEEDSASGVMVVGRAGTRGLSDGVACNDGKTLHTHAHHLAVKRPPPWLAAAQTQAPAPSTTEAAVFMPPAPPTLATPPCAPASRASLATATTAQVGASASHACWGRSIPPESCSRGCVVRDGVGTWCVQEGDTCAQPSSEHP